MMVHKAEKATMKMVRQASCSEVLFRSFHNRRRLSARKPSADQREEPRG